MQSNHPWGAGSRAASHTHIHTHTQRGGSRPPVNTQPQRDKPNTLYNRPRRTYRGLNGPIRRDYIWGWPGATFQWPTHWKPQLSCHDMMRCPPAPPPNSRYLSMYSITYMLVLAVEVSHSPASPMMSRPEDSWLKNRGWPRCEEYIHLNGFSSCVYIQDCLRKLEYCDEVLYFL